MVLYLLISFCIGIILGMCCRDESFILFFLVGFLFSPIAAAVLLISLLISFDKFMRDL